MRMRVSRSLRQAQGQQQGGRPPGRSRRLGAWPHLPPSAPDQPPPAARPAAAAGPRSPPGCACAFQGPRRTCSSRGAQPAALVKRSPDSPSTRCEAAVVQTASVPASHPREVTGGLRYGVAGFGTSPAIASVSFIPVIGLSSS